MKFAEFSVKNSLLINLLSFLVIIIGLFSVFNLRKEAFPQVDYDVVIISTYYPGAPAEDVERLVTIPIERDIKGISGIKEIRSKSEEGRSQIAITIDPKADDKNQVVDDIERAVDRIRDLPEGVKDDPLVFELRSQEIPVLEVSIYGDVPERETRRYAEILEDLILDVKGVASVKRLGWRDVEFHVQVDPKKLKKYHVSIDEIMHALRTRNVTLPAGHLTTDKEEFNIRTTAEFKHVKDIENVIIRANDAGNWLRVRDVAKVTKGFEDRTTIARTNGKRSLGMVVIKNKSADIIRVVGKVNKVISEFRKTLPKGLDVHLAKDMSFYVKRRLGVLKNNGAIGFVLVVLVLFLFLDPIPAIATAMGIPIALFFTFFMMYIIGISINLVSMLGLILVLGMLVDDGIIVCENVYRYIEKGMGVKDAVIKGASEVVAPVTATILTTFAAFAPLLFMHDLIGKFIKQIPIVVIIALSASLIEAFVVLPSHLADFIGKKRQLNRILEKANKDSWMNKLSDFYVCILKKALKRRYLVFISLCIFFFGVVFFAVVGHRMKVILFTGEGIEDFFIRAEAAKGTSLEKMEQLIKPVEKLVMSMPKTDIASFRTYIGSISDEEKGFDPNEKNGSHLAQITIHLTPMQKRSRTPEQIRDMLRKKMDKIKGFEKLYFYLPKEGPPAGRAIEVGVRGDNFTVLQHISHEIVSFIRKIKGTSDVDTNYEFGKKELRIVVDEQKAKQYYLTINDIAKTVRYAFKGGVATTVKPERADKEVDVVVRFPPAYRNNISDFNSILVLNKFGNLIPLRSVAKIEKREGLYAITHIDGKRTIWITGDVDDVNATSSIVTRKIKQHFHDIPIRYPGYSLKFSGEYEEQKETQTNLFFSFIVAILLIFIILTAIFDSLIQPFIVMTAIPFGLLGILIAFMLHGRPLSFFALMGAVGLTGIVVNDSVVLVDFINKLRLTGKNRRESLVEAGRTRLRPVLMTTITTFLGLFSVAYGIGGGDPFLKPMGLAIIWGLFFATGLTLIVIPCIYAIIDDINERFMRH